MISLQQKHRRLVDLALQNMFAPRQCLMSEPQSLRQEKSSETIRLHQQRGKSCPAQTPKAKTRLIKMEIGNVTVSSFTACLLLVWCFIALCWNAGALLMLASLLLYTAIQAITTTDFQAFIICSTAYFVVSSTNIKLSKEFQQAFIAFGVVYFIGAIDHFSYSHLLIDTKFDRIQPYLITSINAYVLAYLLGGGRRDNVHGLAHYCAKRINWYKLHISSNR